MKSLVDSPEGASQSQEKRNGVCPSMWKMPWSRRSRSMPSMGAQATPSRLKLFMMSISMRSSRGLAVLMLSASMPKVRNLVFVRPLFPLASWFCSISEYSSRTSLNLSPRRGMTTLRA